MARDFTRAEWLRHAKDGLSVIFVRRVVVGLTLNGAKAADRSASEFDSLPCESTEDGQGGRMWRFVHRLRRQVIHVRYFQAQEEAVG